jgi:pyridoxal phosphate enzyme (YggS family)
MHISVLNLLKIKKDIELKQLNKENQIEIIAVSKKFSLEQITPLIEIGHTNFGENKVQEAISKWSDIKKHNHEIKLHMIGKLQTNKVKQAIPLFDYIHSLDNLKLAEKISSEQKKINKVLKLFIQVNIGDEIQKNGINIGDVKNFYLKCINDLKLNIIGLMCIPPISNKVELYFDKMLELKKLTGLKELSMGMSVDYLEAVKFGSSFIRIGSKIFGPRA